MHEQKVNAMITKRMIPVQHLVDIPMSRKAVEGHDLRPHDDLFAQDPHPLDAVNEPAPHAALCLIAHEEYCGLRPPEIVLQMVQDAPRIRHAAGREDDGRSFLRIERTGIRRGFADLHLGELRD